MNVDKISLIDKAIECNNINSFADLGGVWNVDGYYSRYILEKYPGTKGYLVDLEAISLSPFMKSLPNLTIINNSFDAAETLDQIKYIDMVIMFDVLLHQANPSWQKIIELYAPRTKCFVIYNPQYNLPKSIRLITLGKKQYFENTPHTEQEYNYDKLFINETETNPDYRDAHNYWQWAITDDDLINSFETVNFQLTHRATHNPWSIPAINRSFIFVANK